ncbi:sel1 repeat family protein [Acetobacteraceae bacterium]|nr:sel1 repeat family protein [Acetobacteraceae bacterium]
MTQKPSEKTFPAQEILAKAHRALSENDPQDAFTSFEQAANAGNPEAYYELAKLYYENRVNLGDLKDEERLTLAKKHLQKAVTRFHYCPEKLQHLLKEINDALIKEMLKRSLLNPFKTRDRKSFTSLLTFLKVDEATRTHFLTLFDANEESPLLEQIKTL